MGRILRHGASAAALIALAGGVWYAYKSGDDRNESVAPLITATGGPVKVAPKDPGGLQVPHRDKEVYTRFETSSGANKKRLEKQSADGRRASDLPPPPPSMTSPLYGKKPGAAPDPKALTRTSAGRSATQPGGTTGAATKPASPIALVPEKTRPTKRSTNGNSGSNGAIPTYVPRKTPLPQTTAGLIGPYRIQIGSFRSGDNAMQRWFQLKARHGDLLGNLVMVIERVNLGARGYEFRLQAGPLESRDQVRGLCHLLGRRSIACSLVRG
jgi:hypothetical protein